MKRLFLYLYVFTALLTQCNTHSFPKVYEQSQIYISKDFDAVLNEFGNDIDSSAIIYAILTESHFDTTNWILYSSKGMANAKDGLPLFGEILVNKHRVFFGMRTELIQTNQSKIFSEKYELTNELKPDKKIMNCRFYGDSLVYSVVFPEYDY